MMNLCKVCMHTLINEFSFNKLDELKLKLSEQGNAQVKSSS